MENINKKMVDYALEYREKYHISVIPIKHSSDKTEDKRPLLGTGEVKPFQTRHATREEIIAWWSRWPNANIGGMMGEISGCIAIDFDFYKEGGVKNIKEAEELLGNLPHTPRSQTGNGGEHWIYKHPGKKIKPGSDILGKNIDVRGDGSYIILPPSIGGVSGRPYTWIQGFDEIELAPLPSWFPLYRENITPLYTGDIKNNNNGTGTPGDDFNAHATREEILSLLTQHGWKIIFSQKQVDYLCRPGKDKGISATFGFIAPNILYVFSTNADPFQSDHAYKPFSVYGLLAHRGDFSSAACALVERGFGTQLKKKDEGATSQNIIQIFKGKRFGKTISLETNLGTFQLTVADILYQNLFILRVAENFGILIPRIKSKEYNEIIKIWFSHIETVDVNDMMLSEMIIENLKEYAFKAEEFNEDSLDEMIDRGIPIEWEEGFIFKASRFLNWFQKIRTTKITEQKMYFLLESASCVRLRVGKKRIRVWYYKNDKESLL